MESYRRGLAGWVCTRGGHDGSTGAAVGSMALLNLGG